MFHLDEYIDMPENHPASFKKYLKERLINKVHPGAVYLIKGEAEDSESECQRLNKIINTKEIDVSFIGIGENGHLAFNDPPADFNTERPYIVVELDESCRRQQFGEGWFNSLEGDISPDHPPSILREHKNVSLFLDKNSAKLLNKHKLNSYVVDLKLNIFGC